MNLEGIITALVTPFDEKGKIVESSLRKLCKFQLNKQVNGLLILGTTGEGISLNLEERKLVAEIVVDELKGKLPIMVHVGSSNINEVFSLAKHAVDIGADSITSITPYFFKMSDKEIFDFYLELSKNVPNDYPVYLYNFPTATGNDITPEVIKKLIEETNNILGIKYSSDNMMRIQEYLKLQNPNFKVFTGADQLFYPMLCLGCDGLVSGNANIFPELFVTVFKSFKKNDHKTAKLFHQYGNEIAKLFKYGNIPAIKAGMKLREIDGGYVRRPFRNLCEEEKNKLQKEFSLIFDQILNLKTLE
jgi:4-hydroxy-tetrahydrodipicolinate synthase